MDIRQIRYFIRVVDTGSLSRAASNLRLSQPALGLQIRKLERELGCPLLLRHSRGIVPTEDGRTVYDRFIAILREIDDTPQYLPGRSGPPQGMVSLGVTASMGLVLVPALVALAASELPKVQLRLVDGVSNDILNGVESGDFDLGLSGMPRHNGQLSCEPMMVEDVFLIVPRGHSAASERPIRLAQVARYPLVLPTVNHPMRQLLDEQLRRHNLTVDPQFELDSVILRKEMVLQSGKLTVLPFSAMHYEIANGSVYARHIEKPRVSHTMHLVSSVRRPPTRATLAIKQLIHRLVEQLIRSERWQWRPPLRESRARPGRNPLQR